MKTLFSLCLAAGFFTTAGRHAVPSYVDITWMSITNMYYELGPLHIVTDGYISRLPASVFSHASRYQAADSCRPIFNTRQSVAEWLETA